ncbi:type VI secretion system baseplate subunit TssE [Sansalvadorimonas sp. 2012CJ34-2]|uniref:Type VI secretion system baseplate subunit TssE n=1 Tax=Parendozoicomonas callyspongiae TaxID=2942213 RepID=A0ABT0PJ74_9GAMM|nr:type VI secretion system baseplate subunit TssE [Sansalvadorimonas sp. 2012CJ34-2]MCL6271444.1 type VI secretion system baseplate subunit TssE [Sansalvadorimonas sp. 2012CJ34-2]
MSLLDRFSTQSVADQDDIRQSICRNLEMVLESRRPMIRVMEAAAELPASLYGYGLGNLHRCRHSVEASDICRDLEQLIQQFEPRLQEVVVELAKVDEQHNALCFHIEASIVGDDGDRESFDTTINLTNSTLMIEGYQ